VRIDRADFKRMRLPVALAVLLIGLGAGFVAVSESWLADAKVARGAAAKSSEEAQKKVAQVSEEEREIKENMVWYARMSSRGMVDQENRLDLIDSIAKIKAARKLFEIRYTIDSQKPLAYPGMTPAGALDLAASRMRLEMQLLHEEDLLKFLSDLEAAALSQVSIRHCTIDRLERNGVQASSASPRLSSICEVDLVVVKPVKS